MPTYIDVIKFEEEAPANTIRLVKSGEFYPSNCFIIHDPKMREVFAAHFRDRIVHHLFYNYTYKVFENTFIYDSYSCIKNRGTHFGIERLKHHILSVSKGYSKPCWHQCSRQEVFTIINKFISWSFFTL